MRRISSTQCCHLIALILRLCMLKQILTLLRAVSRTESPPEITQIPVKIVPSRANPSDLASISLPRMNPIRICPFRYGKSPIPRYKLSDGSKYSSGKIQSPFGNLALISTRPYLKLNDFFERNLADTTGGKIRFEPAWRSHSCFGSINDVHLKFKLEHSIQNNYNKKKLTQKYIEFKLKSCITL